MRHNQHLLCLILPGLIFFGLLCPKIALADFNESNRVYQSGNWTVYRSVDPMHDTVSCTGIYKDQFGIQLTDETFFIRVSGGIEGITLRFGDKPANKMRLASKLEKEVRAVFISGSEFEELLSSPRLRVEVITLIQGITYEDIDLAGIRDAYKNIRGRCPTKGEPPQAEESPKAESEPLCPFQLITRMEEQGLTSAQINAICAP